MAEAAHFVTDPHIWAEQVVERFEGRPETRQHAGILIADICGTLIDADYSFHQYYAMAAAKAGFEPEAIADITAFRADGHRAHLGHADITPNYAELKNQLMHDSELHVNMPPMANSVDLAGRGTRHGLPHGYLSTRPEKIGDATYYSLRNHGFAEAPMLLRSRDISYDRTVNYKLDSLSVLRATLDAHRLHDRPIVFVDDYSQLIDDVNRSGMNVVGVHFDALTSWGVIARDHLGIGSF